MEILDIIICVILLIGAYRGFTKGFLYTLAILTAVVLGIIGGFQLANKASAFLQEKFYISSGFLPFISFLLVFIGIIILVILLAKLLEKVLKATALGWTNKIAGAVFGIFKMAFFISSAFWLLKPVEKKFPVISEDQKKQSALYKTLSIIAPAVLPTLREGYSKVEGKIKESIK